jgi:hypothetical protein
VVIQLDASEQPDVPGFGRRPSPLQGDGQVLGATVAPGSALNTELTLGTNALLGSHDAA